MGKYYLYSGKQVGFVRKAIDEVVMVEEGWISEVQNHFGKRTHDKLLQIPAQILKNSGFPDITRAQAWIILKELLRDEIPDALQNKGADEVSTKGNLFATAKNTAASAVDTVVSPVGKVVGGGLNAVSKVVKKDSKSGDE